MHHFALEAQHHALAVALATIAVGLMLGHALLKLIDALARIGPRRAHVQAVRQARAKALGCRVSQLKGVERAVSRSRGRR